MDRLHLPMLASWLFVLGVAFVSMTGSFGYLGDAMRSLVERTAPSTAPDGPDFVANIEALPSGSVSAIVPLPAAKAPTVTTSMPAGAPQQETVAIATPVAVATPATAGAQARMVVSISVNVRDRPSNNSRVIGTLRQGTAVAVLGTHQGWMQVGDGGQNGWVYGRYLRPANQASRRNPVKR